MTTSSPHPPTKLQLFPFQETCVTKLSDLSVPSGLIGDDMGLGKTVEAIAIDARKRKADLIRFQESRGGKGLTLVVCPHAVISSWVRHFQRWNPKLRVCAIDPKDRPAFLHNVMKGSYDVYVIHWQGMRLIRELQQVWWFHIIADEVHRAKNRKAQQTIALKKLRADHKLGCSGTPADNKPSDFWSVLNWLYPRKFSAFWEFRNHHEIIKHHDPDGNCGCYQEHKRPFDEIIGVAYADELQERIEPFYVRRLKEEVWDDMPEKYYTEIEVDLHPKQKRAYNEMRKAMLAWIGKHEDEPIAAPVVIAQLTRLQQFACAYARLEQVFRRKSNCRICLAAHWTKCQGHWVDQLYMEEPSSKLDAALDIIEDNPGKQIACFSQSKQMVYMLERRLAKRGVGVAMYTGDNPDTRDRMVEEFQDGRRTIFAGTIAAGGEGIELTAAHRMIFFDRAWSPSRNKQAEDRCHRFGQHNAVQVVDLVAKGTIDRGRNQKINLKWAWLKEILGDAPTGTTEWIDDDGIQHQGIKALDSIFGR